MLIRTISISRPLSVQIRKVGTLRHWRVLSSICFRFGHALGARAYVLSVSYLVGFGYAKAPWGVCSRGLPVRVMRRRTTLPHPVGCSTIAVPGLSFRVRNGTGRLSWAMAAANLGLSAGKQGVSRRRVAVRGPDNGRDSLLLTDRARVRTVLPVRLRGALPGPAPHTLAGVWMWVASRPLVPVGSTPRGASTSGLSTTCSAWGLQRLGAAWNPYLGEGFPLRCFQRLSLPNVANRPRHWRDDRHTRGSSTQVLSYYGQASSRFQRAQRIETKLSHDVLNPARVPL